MNLPPEVKQLVERAVDYIIESLGLPEEEAAAVRAGAIKEALGCLRELAQPDDDGHWWEYEDWGEEG